MGPLARRDPIAVIDDGGVSLAELDLCEGGLDVGLIGHQVGPDSGGGQSLNRRLSAGHCRRAQEDLERRPGQVCKSIDVAGGVAISKVLAAIDRMPSLAM